VAKFIDELIATGQFELVEPIYRDRNLLSFDDPQASNQYYLDLIKAPQAWAFLDRCHDAGLARLLASGAVSDLPRSREAFRSALLHKVSESPYYDDVLRFNGGSIEPPER